MKKLCKIIYAIRILFLIIHLGLIFTILNNIIRTGLFGYLFLIVDTIYVIRIIIELLSHKKCYQNDLAYNIMQIGVFIYTIIFWSKTYFLKISLLDSTKNYFQNNYIILSILLIFLIFYSRILIKTKK